MTKTLVERIAAILGTHDVRDPRGALDAIDKIITFCREHLEQRHITALNSTMVKFCNEMGDTE